MNERDHSPIVHVRIVAAVIAVLWALFQLTLPQFIILDRITIRAIHLTFALLLIFVAFPFKLKKGEERFCADQPFWGSLLNLFLGVIASAAVLYIVIDWNGIAVRSGTPLPRDIVIGLVAVVLLLEASRRVVGPALSIVALVFTLYAFLGPYLPELLAFRGVSLRKYMTQVFLSSEGIYGIPLGVSASIVYLFVLLGALLERAGAGGFFIRLALSALGKYRGGPAKAAVLSSGLMGCISGSSVANIVTTGTFTIPMMKAVGYPPRKAAAIEVAASTDGQLMPPIMGAAAFIIAEYVNVPYVDVIKAAAIPAFVDFGSLFYITHLEACKLGIRGLSKDRIPHFWQTLKGGIHYLVPIMVLLVELLYFRHSPELSAFRSIVALILVIFYQELRKAILTRGSFKEKMGMTVKRSIRIIGNGCIQGSKNMVTVAAATAVAGIIIGIVNLGIGGMLTHIVEMLSGGNILILLGITAFASLILGMGLPTTATYIVMASLTAPIIVQIGTKYGLAIPLISAHLFCFYFGILADDTPPVGLASYAAAALAGSEPIPTGIQGFLYDLRTGITPFMFVFNSDIILLNIHHPLMMLLILAMTFLGACAFTSIMQGWFATKNKWYEVPILVCAMFLLYLPALCTMLIHLDLRYRYLMYLVGILLLAGLYAIQKYRMRCEALKEPI
ncbi:TRAP transporter permease [bacterium]|nr:TRAP transporter permease [bacterium]